VLPYLVASLHRQQENGLHPINLLALAMDHMSLRDQAPVMSSSSSTAAARQRSKFTADVIRAIEELETRRSNRPSQQLADAAWQKLQFDLPVLEVAELQALLDHMRCATLFLPLLEYNKKHTNS
jgi:hypothetical protein